MSAETWQYVHQRSIADHYDAFVADTPLCRLDQQLLERWLPTLGSASDPTVTNQRAIDQTVIEQTVLDQTVIDQTVIDQTVIDQTVIDLGAGTGRAAVELAGRGYRVVAVDLSQPMLVQLQQKIDPFRGQWDVHPVRANLVDLGCFGDRSADHAICLFSTLGMIQGREHRRSLLKRTSRIVRPGGKLVVHVHNRWAALRERKGITRLLRSWIQSRRNREREFGDAIYPYRGLPGMFLHRFSAGELRRDLQRSGWRIKQFQRISIDGAHADSSAIIPGGFIVLAECVGV